jgi:pimeloyl-ACP methyl ester carboxylesterase
MRAGCHHARMPAFTSHDGTKLAYRVVGSGPMLICVPGGPGRASEYLGDLGGLGGARSLVQLDMRGTGASAVPADPATYRVDQLVDDVEALRAHLGLDTIDLLGHSAGSNVVTLYAAAYPRRITSLTLVTGLARVAGLPLVAGLPRGYEQARAARSGEPWFADAIAADKAWDDLGEDATEDEEASLSARLAPFSYGRWDATAQAHAVAAPAQISGSARAGFYGDYQADPVGLRERLAHLAAPVLVIAGEVDAAPTPAAAAEVAALFPNSRVATIPGGGHFPWLDNAAEFCAAFAN